MDFTIKTFGKIDILVLCAGVGAHLKFSEQNSLDVFRKIMDTNFFGYVYLTKAALDTVRQQKG